MEGAEAIQGEEGCQGLVRVRGCEVDAGGSGRLYGSRRTSCSSYEWKYRPSPPENGVSMSKHGSGKWSGLFGGISGFLECSTKKGAIKDSAAEVKRGRQLCTVLQGAGNWTFSSNQVAPLRE